MRCPQGLADVTTLQADFTFVCPSEIVAFSDRIEEFREIDAEVVSLFTFFSPSVRTDHAADSWQSPGGGRQRRQRVQPLGVGAAGGGLWPCCAMLEGTHMTHMSGLDTAARASSRARLGAWGH